MDQDEYFSRITLRIPKELHEKIVADANTNQMSANAEIIKRLESSYSFAFRSEMNLSHLITILRLMKSYKMRQPSIMSLIVVLIIDSLKNIPKNRKVMQVEMNVLLKGLMDGIFFPASGTFPYFKDELKNKELEKEIIPARKIRKK